MTPFEVGDVLRYGGGETALMQVHTVNNGGYYGDHCLGGQHFSSHRSVRLATDEERAAYFAHRRRAFAHIHAANGDTQANIEECKAIAKQHDSQAVVVMRVERDGMIYLSTYGEDKHKCDVIGEWAQKSISPFLLRVPFETLFGWGKDGVPTPLEMREYMSLVPAAKAYYDRVKPPEKRRA